MIHIIEYGLLYKRCLIGYRVRVTRTEQIWPHAEVRSNPAYIFRALTYSGVLRRGDKIIRRLREGKTPKNYIPLGAAGIAAVGAIVASALKYL